MAVEAFNELGRPLKIIGAGGRINDIGNLTLSDQNLMMTFCELAIAQPPECLV